MSTALKGAQPKLSVTGYRAALYQLQGRTAKDTYAMSTSDRAQRPSRATKYLVKDLEEVGYEYSTHFLGWIEEDGEVPKRRDVSSARTLRTPYPFPYL
ncbi:hypothetical protein Plhal304r1_c032g0102751 [Plasmopara halstedii]